MIFNIYDWGLKKLYIPWFKGAFNVRNDYEFCPKTCKAKLGTITSNTDCC